MGLFLGRTAAAKSGEDSAAAAGPKNSSDEAEGYRPRRRQNTGNRSPLLRSAPAPTEQRPEAVAVVHVEAVVRRPYHRPVRQEAEAGQPEQRKRRAQAAAIQAGGRRAGSEDDVRVHWDVNGRGAEQRGHPGLGSSS